MVRANLRSVLPSTEWTKEWPAEEGWFWFYGWNFGNDEKPKRLFSVKVSGPLSDKVSYMAVCEGHFIFRREAIGVWTKMVMPDLPKEVANA